MKKEICLFGYSGHSYVIIESLLKSDWKIKGYLNYQAVENNPYNIEYLGFENDSDFKEKVGDSYVFPAMGNNSVRKKLIALFEDLGLKQATIIDNSAIVSPTAQIEKSTFIGPNAVINAFALVGKGAIINSNATIEHETKLGDFVHIAPGAVLCGNVNIGDSTFIGANTVIREKIFIGKNVIIGAGSVVVRNQMDDIISYGNPAIQR